MFNSFFQKNLTLFASLISLGVTIMLTCIKIWACLKTGSIALLTSVADGLIDIIASIITLIGIYYAQRPADREHRYGHGKAEAVAVFVQSLLLIAAGIALIIEAINRIIIPQILFSQQLGIIITIISTICAGLLVAIQTIVIKQTKSTAISADRAHYITDIAVNITVLFTLILAHKFNWLRADACSTLGISSYMIWNTRNMVKSALLQLLDRELSNTDRFRITEITLKCFGVEGVHDLRTRNGGDRVFIELHVEVNGRLTVDAGHAICDNAELEVKKLFNMAEVSAHLEPTGISDKRLDDLIKKPF